MECKTKCQTHELKTNSNWKYRISNILLCKSKLSILEPVKILTFILKFVFGTPREKTGWGVG